MNQFIGQCSDGMRLLDVGAHWGIFSLAALHFGGRDARVVCVEPSTAAMRFLEQNLAANDALERCWLIPAAAGAEDGIVQMLEAGAAGADYFVVPDTIRHDTIQVRQVRLSALCRDLNFSPTHIKIDVEGYEEEALTGGTGIFRDLKPILFLELHGDILRRRRRSPEAILMLLEKFGYTRWFEGGVLQTKLQLEQSKFNARLLCLPPQ